MTYTTIKYETQAPVGLITLNRPERLNAWMPVMSEEMADAIERANRDKSIGAIVVTGEGRGFCAGLDLKGTGDYSPLSEQTRYLDDMSWISRFPLVLRQACEKPIVAGINGVAVGAGLSLALAADIRIMSRDARILAGYPRIGGSPDGGMTFTLPQLIGYEQTMRFLLESKTVDADEAYRLGIVGEVVDADRFEARLAEYCQQLARVSPITSRLTKRTVVKATTDVDLESQLRLEIASIGRAFASNDGKEARKAFLEKRDPVFEGR